MNDHLLLHCQQSHLRAMLQQTMPWGFQVLNAHLPRNCWEEGRYEYPVQQNSNHKATVLHENFLKAKKADLPKANHGVLNHHEKQDLVKVAPGQFWLLQQLKVCKAQIGSPAFENIGGKHDDSCVGRHCEPWKPTPY